MRLFQSKTIQTILGAAAILLSVPFGASALTVSPPTIDFNVNPEDTVLDVIRVYNEGKTAVTLYPMLVNFSASGDETGSPAMVTADSDIGGMGLAKWLSVSEAGFTVQPNERVNFPFSISVPKDAQPGGHYGAILLSSVPPEEMSSGVGVASQLGVLLLANVSGAVRESGAVVEFGFDEPKVWYNHLPVDFFLRFENSGNTHLRPTGKLVIKDWIGREVASIGVNGSKNSVLPLSIRKFMFGWSKSQTNDDDLGLIREWKNFGFGKYTATLLLSYGRTTTQLVTQERTFYVWPWRLMAIAAVALIAVLTSLWKFGKAYERSVIKRYQAKQGRWKIKGKGSEE